MSGIGDWDLDAEEIASESRDGLLDTLVLMRCERARMDAVEHRILATLAAADHRDDPLGKEWVRDEVACVLRISPDSARARLALATDLITQFPATVTMMRTGQLPGYHARRLTDATSHLPREAAAQVETRVLARAGRQTWAQFGATLRRAVLAADPRVAEQRRRDALQDLRVAFTPHDNGTTELWALLSTEGAAQLKTALDHAARHTTGLDGRTADQRRADALCDLATLASLTGTPAGARSAGPAVQVTVALSTLLGLDEQGGELNGEAVPASVARALAHDPTGTWRRILTDHHDDVIEVSSSYRPAAALARTVRAQYPTCAFPGCRRSSRTCELDHRVAWQDGGPTSTENLQPLCRRHHVKHDAGWHVWRSTDHTTHWRSPTGRHHQTQPERPPQDTTMINSTAGTVGVQPRADQAGHPIKTEPESPPF
jgi:Domain of unknown function (DUF222)/HNH endonuclease